MNNNRDLSNIRDNYNLDNLSISNIPTDPNDLFHEWMQKALNNKLIEATAMTLATSLNNIPSARTVLLKKYDVNSFVFYTNYNSKKGMALKVNPNACLLFFWKELQRQVRITGVVQKVSSEESDAYFKSRPIDSQIGATISPQSKEIASKEWLKEAFDKEKKLSGSNLQLKRPDNWGGYRLIPNHFEFWQGRPNRLHDRVSYDLNVHRNVWTRAILAP